MTSAFLKLDRVTKRFRNVVAVDKVSLDVGKGELLVLLGPSGCGKTTTLRIIAGLETPDEGRVYIDGVDVTDMEPGDRDVSMVFQDYALYPHMSVFDNIAFPLTVRRGKLRLSRRDIEERVLKVAKMLRIEELLDRKPPQLSGGQQQRVALARALVREPKVWLMDEPLSNLDALVRMQVRAELKRLQKDLGITTVYVTHDQIEALTLADRIAVMNKGRILQVGSPKDVYENPEHVFVATFIGAPPMNILECEATKEIIECPGFSKPLSPSTRGLQGKLYVGIRPEHIEIVSISEITREDVVEARVYVVEPLGSEYIVNVVLGGEIVKVRTSRELLLSPGDTVYLKINWSKASVFDFESGRSLGKLLKALVS